LLKSLPFCRRSPIFMSFWFSASLASPRLTVKTCALLGGLSLGLSWFSPLSAAPNPAPPQVQSLVEQFDALANRRDLTALKALYNENFKTGDGLDLSAYQTALESLWERYPELTYKTQITGWEQAGDRLIVQTQTTLEGTGQWQGNPARLAGVIESKQTYVGNQLLEQSILSEKITLTAGANPPEVAVQLPASVKPGQEFDFDVILAEPLGETLVAGAAFAQPIRPSAYLNPLKVELELLQAGGLFKRAKAPKSQNAQWYSALLISNEGTTYVTQRLRVEP
jgi:hypothetical protein